MVQWYTDNTSLYKSRHSSNTPYGFLTLAHVLDVPPPPANAVLLYLTVPEAGSPPVMGQLTYDQADVLDVLAQARAIRQRLEAPKPEEVRSKAQEPDFSATSVDLVLNESRFTFRVPHLCRG